jgi:hypothetical protein
MICEKAKCKLYLGNICVIQTIPVTIVVRRLTSLSTVTSWSTSSPSPFRYSTTLNELDFRHQLWLTENASGALVIRVIDDPVMLVHGMVKYANTDP